jgi:hypothetical protein
MDQNQLACPVVANDGYYGTCLYWAGQLMTFIARPRLTR